MAVKPSCESFVSVLSAFMDGELSVAQRHGVQAHLTNCTDCTARFADLRATSSLMHAGMEMLADEANLDGFADQVIARLTPARLSLFDRWSVSLQEMFRYQRGFVFATVGAAAAVVAVAAVMLAQPRPQEGYANERMALGSVTTDESAHVAPVVLETDNGDSIIWVVDHDHVQLQGAPDASHKEIDSPVTSGQNGTKSTGGNL